MKIIYVMDPYDGWCYAGSENILRLYMRYHTLNLDEIYKIADHLEDDR